MAYPFLPSPHLTRTEGRRIDLIVLHTMEAAERDGAAESCARWFQNPRSRLSAHYCVDASSVVQCVRDQDVAWHAPGANHDGLGIELAGRAGQSRREWADGYSAAVLERGAELTAGLCRRYSIPAVWLWPPDLLAGRRGLTSHSAVSEAFGRSTHLDPGLGFPAERYLALVRSHLGTGTNGELLKRPPPTLRRGAQGWQVMRLQRLLRRQGQRGLPAQVDGVFGSRTEAAVRAFQALHGLEADGIVGPLTWRALLGA
ncbi:MAG: N-acetylmuramoyl-L-alanine amidase [Actinobacteria bacterium]|nr:N-acetylmuramoyl-L-alanine amidase [Actinomycetota bacterium]